MHQIQVATPLGPIVLTGDNQGLRSANFASLAKPGNSCPLLEEAALQIQQWFDGDRRSFDLAMTLQGTQFQQAVWHQLMDIPWGRTRTYGDIAKSLNIPGGARAVGGACGANPLILLIPCHRVLSGNGKLGGFSSGLALKRDLLKREGIQWKE